AAAAPRRGASGASPCRRSLRARPPVDPPPPRPHPPRLPRLHLGGGDPPGLLPAGAQERGRRRTGLAVGRGRRDERPLPPRRAGGAADPRPGGAPVPPAGLLPHPPQGD